METVKMTYPLDLQKNVECNITVFSEGIIENGMYLEHRVDENDKSDIKTKKTVLTKYGLYLSLGFSERFVKEYGNAAVEKICMLRTLL